MNKTVIEQQVKLFWDIDGTLLHTHGAAAAPFVKAVSEFAGQEVKIDRKNFSGLTDYEIARQLLESVDLKTSFQTITEILWRYANLLPDYLKGSSANVVGEVQESLTKLSDLPNIELAVGTGNFTKGAQIKLEHVGLLSFFDPKNLFCATEDQWNRNQVIDNAKKSLRKDQIGIILGDSLRDILSARNANLPVIAVATGLHSPSELLALNPDYLLSSGWSYSELMEGIRKIILSINKI